MASWSLFSNHGHVIITLGVWPNLTHREIAEKVGITERAVQKIIADLATSGFISIKKDGRKNTYNINQSKHLKHQIESICEVREIIDLVKSKQVSQ